MHTFILRTVNKKTDETHNAIRGSWYTMHYKGSNEYNSIIKDVGAALNTFPNVIIVFDDFITFCYPENYSYYIMTGDGKTFEVIR